MAVSAGEPCPPNPNGVSGDGGGEILGSGVSGTPHTLTADVQCVSRPLPAGGVERGVGHTILLPASRVSKHKNCGVLKKLFCAKRVPYNPVLLLFLPCWAVAMCFVAIHVWADARTKAKLAFKIHVASQAGSLKIAPQAISTIVNVKGSGKR